MPEDKELYQKRDMMLGEIHSSVKHTEETIKSVRDWCEKHDVEDNVRFKDINQKLLYGAVAIIIVAFASGVLGNLLTHIKIGV